MIPGFGNITSIFFAPFVAIFTTAARWMVDQILKLTTTATTPEMSGAWWNTIYSKFTMVGAIFALLFLLIAAGMGGLRGDGNAITRAIKYGLGWGLLAAAAPMAVGLAAKGIDWACYGVDSSLGHDAGKTLGAAVKFPVGDPIGIGLLGALAIVAAGLLFFAELVARDVVLLMVTAFSPILLAGLIWKDSLSWARTAGRLLAVALMTKFILVGGAAVGFAVLANAHLAGGGFGLSCAAAIVLLALGVAPMMIFRHAPGGAPAFSRTEIGRVTGVSHATRAATVAMKKVS